MKGNKYNKTCKELTIKKALGILVLAIIMLVTVAGAAPNAYITNDNDNHGTVTVIDTATNTVIKTVDVGLAAFGVAVNPAGTKAYIGNWGSGTVSVIDTATNTVIATISNVGWETWGVSVNPAGTKVYVTNINNGDGTLAVIDAATNTVTAKVPVGSYPYGVAVNPAGTKVYVANGNSKTVSVLDTATNIVTATVNVGTFPYGVAVNPTGTEVYVTNMQDKTVSVIDTATNTVISTLQIGDNPWAITLNPAGTKLYVVSNNVTSIIDTATNTVTTTVPVGGSRSGISFTPDGTRVYVVGKGNVTVIDASTNKVTTTMSNVGVIPVAFGQFIVPSSPNITSVSLNPQNIELHPGSSQTAQIVLNKVPANGLAGSNITVSISDPTIANISAVFPPVWAGVSANSTVPSSSVWIKAANFGQIKAEDTNVSLGSINITGIKAGNSSINIVPTEIDDNNGDPINPSVIAGNVHVVLILPFPGCTNSPKDLNNDGIYEDINGNGRFDFADVVVYFNNMTWITQNSLTAYFDFNHNSRIDFNDVVLLFNMH